MAYQLVLPSQANTAAYQRAPMVGPVALPAGAPAAARSRLGLSGCGCGCSESGLGFFESGMDVSSWGWQEWAAVLVGAYAVGSMVFTTGRGVSRVRAIPGARRKRERERLNKRLKELTR